MLEINEFRELTKASRNFSVALLEKFDNLGITKRTENGRKKIKIQNTDKSCRIKK